MATDGSRIVGIAEMAVSVDPTETLVTYSLGSCVGLSLVDPVAGVGGLLHAMMPVSTMDPARAAQSPAMFADSGTLALLKDVFDRGATRANLIAKIAGAATQVDQHGLFRIGERNLMVLRRVLWRNDILISAEDCGGAISRTMLVEMATGRTLVKSNGTLRELQ